MVFVKASCLVMRVVGNAGWNVQRRELKLQTTGMGLKEERKRKRLSMLDGVCCRSAQRKCWSGATRCLKMKILKHFIKCALPRVVCELYSMPMSHAAIHNSSGKSIVV